MGNAISPTVPIGGTVEYKKGLIRVTNGVRGCQGCVFETCDGALTCRHTESCFAHLRPDRRSVIFVALK